MQIISSIAQNLPIDQINWPAAGAAAAGVIVSSFIGMAYSLIEDIDTANTQSLAGRTVHHQK